MENISKHQDLASGAFNKVVGQPASEEEAALVRACGDLVYVDKFMFVYTYDRKLYCMQPDQPLRDEVTELLGPETPEMRFADPELGREKLHPTAREAYEDHRERMKDPAKFELDYDPAEVLHLVHELAYSLRELYSDMKETQYPAGNTDFHKRTRMLVEASDLLDRYKNEYLGGSWDEHDEQDQLYR